METVESQQLLDEINAANLNLDEVLCAVQRALDGAGDLDLVRLMLLASNAMPAGASDYDRGLAAGIALGWRMGSASAALDHDRSTKPFR